MPFKSTKQRAFMFAKHPKMAKEWQSATPKDAALPEYADDSLDKHFVKLGDYMKPKKGKLFVK